MTGEAFFTSSHSGTPGIPKELVHLQTGLVVYGSGQHEQQQKLMLPGLFVIFWRLFMWAVTAKPLLVDDGRLYYPLYIGGYNNPTSIMEWYRDFEHVRGMELSKWLEMVGK